MQNILLFAIALIAIAVSAYSAHRARVAVIQARKAERELALLDGCFRATHAVIRDLAPESEAVAVYDKLVVKIRLDLLRQEIESSQK